MDGSQFPVRLRAPTPRNHAPNEPRVEVLAPKGEDHDVEHADDERRDEPRKGMLRRHPFVFVGGLILLFVALSAAMSIGTTPRISIDGRRLHRCTSVHDRPEGDRLSDGGPVTDNEHVVAGQMIARIDDRDYRNALARLRLR